LRTNYLRKIINICNSVACTTERTCLLSHHIFIQRWTFWKRTI